MTIELRIPEVGESITEVQITEWLKTLGDAVTADEPVAVIDSEKTTFELRAPKNGTLTTILHPAGETVKVGEVIARIESDGKITNDKPSEAKVEDHQETTVQARLQPRTPEAPAQAQDKTQREVPKPESAKSADDGEDDSTRRPAETGSEGRTTQTIGRAIAAVDETQPQSPRTSPRLTPSSDREEEVVPMTMLRRTIARRLVQAHQTMATLTTFNELDMSAVQVLRRELGEAFEKRYSVKLGLMSFFVKAAIDALKQFPMLNAEIRDTDIIYRNYFDIGVAIATERGLVVPVLRDAQCMSFAELEQAIGGFARSARDGKLKPDDLEGGTFTITNGGVFGSLLSTPIINPPQTGILGMHTIQERPVVLQGRVVIRPMMYLALTYDHRLVDGREAVLFLRRVKEGVESPARLLLEV